MDIISDNEISFGSAGVAELYGRFYILHKLMHDPELAKQLISIDFASNKGWDIDKCPWKPFYTSDGIIPWGGNGREGELFRFVFHDDDANRPPFNSGIQTKAHALLNGCITDLDKIFNVAKTSNIEAVDIDDKLRQVLKDWNARKLKDNVSLTGESNAADVFEAYIETNLHIKTFIAVPSKVKCSAKPYCSKCNEVYV